jgi:hypothetical protein
MNAITKARNDESTKGSASVCLAPQFEVAIESPAFPIVCKASFKSLLPFVLSSFRAFVIKPLALSNLPLLPAEIEIRRFTILDHRPLLAGHRVELDHQMARSVVVEARPAAGGPSEHHQVFLPVPLALVGRDFRAVATPAGRLRCDWRTGPVDRGFPRLNVNVAITP